MKLKTHTSKFRKTGGWYKVRIWHRGGLFCEELPSNQTSILSLVFGSRNIFEISNSYIWPLDTQASMHAYLVACVTFFWRIDKKRMFLLRFGLYLTWGSFSVFQIYSRHTSWKVPPHLIFFLHTQNLWTNMRYVCHQYHRSSLTTSIREANCSLATLKFLPRKTRPLDRFEITFAITWCAPTPVSQSVSQSVSAVGHW